MSETFFLCEKNNKQLQLSSKLKYIYINKQKKIILFIGNVCIYIKLFLHDILLLINSFCLNIFQNLKKKKQNYDFVNISFYRSNNFFFSLCNFGTFLNELWRFNFENIFLVNIKNSALLISYILTKCNNVIIY